MNILALDLATRTGWAIQEGTGPILSGVQEFKLGRGESPGMRYIRFERWLAEMLVAPAVPLALSPPRNRVDLVVYEQSLRFHLGGSASDIAGALVGFLQAACARYGIEHLPVNVATIKKFATGKGNAKKPEMILRAVASWPEQFGPGAPDDNQADALHLLAYSLKLYGELPRSPTDSAPRREYGVRVPPETDHKL